MPGKRNKNRSVSSSSSCPPGANQMKKSDNSNSNGHAPIGDTIFANLAASDDAELHDKLKSLQEMFGDKIDHDVIRDVLHEKQFNVEQALEILLEISNANQVPDINGSSMAFPNDSFSPFDCVEDNQFSNYIVDDDVNMNAYAPHKHVSLQSAQASHSLASPQLLPSSSFKTNKALNAVMPWANLPLFSNSPSNKIAMNTTKSSLMSPASRKPNVTHESLIEQEIKKLVSSRSAKVLVIMRGLPGSGKSTQAHKLVTECRCGIILSTDEYFKLPNGRYRFNRDQLPQAHEWNQERAKHETEKGTRLIIVDNTNIEAWEMKPYVSLGKANGFRMFILEPETPWKNDIKKLAKINRHHVPKDTIRMMADRYQHVTIEEMIHCLRDNEIKKVEPQESNFESALHNVESSPSCSNEDIRDQSSPSSISEKLECVTSSSPHQINIPSVSIRRETHDESSITQEASEGQIDFDLLLTLSQRGNDSESSSSVNASESGSQEVGWERDEEFTWSGNKEIQNEEISNDEKKIGLSLNANEPQVESPKPQREKRNKNASKETDVDVIQDIKGEWNLDEESNGQASSNTVLEMNYQPRRVFSLVGFKKSKDNWSFPPFPNKIDEDASNGEQTFVECFSIHTQTESKDWAILELSQCQDMNGLETAEVECSLSDCQTGKNYDKEELESSFILPLNRTNLKVNLDKGTCTNDLPDCDSQSHDEKLQSLVASFPKAEESHLKEILNDCHGSYKWAFKLLSQFENEHFELNTFEQISLGSNENENHIEDEDIKCINETVEELEQVEEKVPLDLVTDETRSKSEFILRLDPFFAAQLEKHFGPIDKENTGENNLEINLSHGIARLIHHNWKKTCSTSSRSVPKSLVKNNIKPKAQSKANLKSKLDQELPRGEFHEIMQYEMALQKSREEYERNRKLNMEDGIMDNKDLISTKLKAEQLYLRYPTADKNMLDEIFCFHDYHLGKSIQSLDESIGDVAPFNSSTVELLSEENGISIEDCFDDYETRSRSRSPSKQTFRSKDAMLTEMHSLFAKKKDFHVKAQKAYQRKMFAVASYYADEASSLSAQIERISKELVDCVLSTSNNSNQLDLHGLHVAEVNVVISEYLRRKYEELERCQGKRRLIIEIITGYGASIGVQGRIKPTVIQYLKQMNYKYEIANEGMVRVIMTLQ